MNESAKTLWMDQLLAAMSEWQASDLFVTEGKAPAVRVHGQVRPVRREPITGKQVRQWLESAFRPLQLQSFEASGDLDASYTSGSGQRFRVNLSRQRGSLSIVARALASGELELEALGLPPVVARMAELPRGLVLVTGATGSGKSTTLAALIHRVNRARSAHIVTIEDPIEFLHRDLKARITQREIGTDTSSFAAGLRYVLRQSPDIVMIGEVRDRETVAVAIQAALTGHLILATLHTIDASQTIQRLLSFFPEHLQGEVALDLSLTLEGIVSQRLVPTASGTARVLAAEVLTRTPGVARLLKEQRLDDLVDLMRTTSDPSITTFDRSLLRLYREEKIALDVARSYSTNPDEFAQRARGMASGIESVQGRPAAAHDLDIEALLHQALEQEASDLHLAVGRPAILRMAGELKPLEMEPLTTGDLRQLLNSIMTVRQRSAFEIERELDFAISLADGRRFRANAYYQRGEIACALRAIPSTVPDAETLRIPQIVLELGNRPHGLILVVGPTGSGKSTTLACLVDRINRTRACRIITIEDPIEYVHESVKATVDQREVYADTKSFASALKYILRQDPDVILVGEMRDLETISAALTAAETGHLVLATLHSNDAVQAIDRIVDVFPLHQQEQARTQLAAALVGVISQRLLPRAADPSRRLPVFEVMVATPAIRSLVRDGKMHQALGLIEASRRDGMMTLDAALAAALEVGDITYEEALRYARNPRSLGTRLEAPARPEAARLEVGEKPQALEVTSPQVTPKPSSSRPPAP